MSHIETWMEERYCLPRGVLAGVKDVKLGASL